MTTPATIIATARAVYNDQTATYRKPDTELLGYVNEGMQEISALQPNTFLVRATLTCTVSTVKQAIAFSTAQALVDVLSIQDGAALTEFDVEAMDRFNPNWRTDTAGAAKQWARVTGSPLEFFIYPKAPATAQALDITYVKTPTTLALSDTITEIPAGYMPALADYVIYRCESADDEHSNSGRAATHFQMFVAKIKGG